MGVWQYRKCTQVHTRKSSSSIPVRTKIIQMPLDTEHTLLKTHQVPTGALSSGRTPSTHSPAHVCGKAGCPILMLFHSSFFSPHYNPSSNLCLRGMVFLSFRLRLKLLLRSHPRKSAIARDPLRLTLNPLRSFQYRYAPCDHHRSRVI
jgi:hypothetical protein